MKTLNWAILGTGTIANEMAASMQKHGRPAYAVGNRHMKKQKLLVRNTGFRKFMRTFRKCLLIRK